VEISGALIASEIVLSDGATFVGPLHIFEAKLNVESGVKVQFDSIACDEMTVGGQVRLGTSLSARTITVVEGGILTAPSIRAISVEVSPGGSLQGRIDKYIPRETPRRPEPDPEEEAAGKTEPKVEAKDEAKTEAKAEAKVEAKVEPKAEVKDEPKVETKTEAA
jgi:hypothetical protein